MGSVTEKPYDKFGDSFQDNRPEDTHLESTRWSNQGEFHEVPTTTDPYGASVNDDAARYSADAFPNMHTIGEVLPTANHHTGLTQDRLQYENQSYEGNETYGRNESYANQTGGYNDLGNVAEDSESAASFHDVREGTASPIRPVPQQIRAVAMEDSESSFTHVPVAGDSSLLQSGDGLEPVSSDELSELSTLSHTPYPDPDAERFTPDDYRLSSTNGLAGPRQVAERKPQLVDGSASIENLHRPLSSHMATMSDASLQYGGHPQLNPRKSSSYSPSPRGSPSISPSMAAHRMSGPPAPAPVRPMSVLSLGQSYDLTSSALMPHLGEHAGNLMPRVKTIELYRKNAKKSKDPAIEFQLAQYMVQTALLNSANEGQDTKPSHSRASSLAGNVSLGGGPAPTPSPGTSTNPGNDPDSLTTSSSGSSNANSAPAAAGKDAPIDEARLKRSLLKEALGMLRRLSERGFPDAQYLLGDIYSSTAVGGKPDLEKSARYFLMAAKHQHAEAAYRAALCMQEGWGKARDAPRALRLYKAAAVKNQPGALYQLGMAYFHGRLGIADNANNRLIGLKWLTRAVNVANEIYNKAPYELAKIYEVGYHDIVIPDQGYAARLYARSAELNYIPAAAKLGRAYEFGELGCPQDPGLSIHYYTIAALGNDPTAQLSLGAWYMVGAGPQLPVNEDEAFEWVLRAALNGLPKAMYTLGFFYENGVGCDRDIIAGTKWYRRAANAGEERAIAKLQKHGPEGEKRKEKSKEGDKCVVM